MHQNKLSINQLGRERARATDVDLAEASDGFSLEKLAMSEAGTSDTLILLEGANYPRSLTAFPWLVLPPSPRLRTPQLSSPGCI